MTIAGKYYFNLQYLHGFIDEFGAGKAIHALNDPSAAKMQLETPRFEQRIGGHRRRVGCGGTVSRGGAVRCSVPGGLPIATEIFRRLSP